MLTQRSIIVLSLPFFSACISHLLVHPFTIPTPLKSYDSTTFYSAFRKQEKVPFDLTPVSGARCIYSFAYPQFRFKT